MSRLDRVIFDPDTTPPSTPTMLTPTVVGQNRIDFSWTVATDTGGSGLARYEVLIDGATLVTLGLQTTYSLTGLGAGTTHTARVRAVDGNNNVGAYSNQASATTQPAAGGSTALSDWNARSTAAGVVQAIRFPSSANVTAYAHADGLQGNLAYESWDGLIGDGCLRNNVPRTAGANAGNWRAPLNSSWITDRQGFGSTPFYIQYQVKLGPNRLTPSVNGGGFKICNLSEYIPSSPGSSRSHSSNEIVIGDGFNGPGNWQSILYAYREHPVSGTTPFETSDANGLHEQTIDNGAGISDPFARYCLYQSGAASAGCWRFRELEWFTVYYRIHIVDYGGTGTGNELDIWVARRGEANYTLVYSVRDFRIGSDSALPLGINGIWLLPYDTNRTSASYDTYHKNDQLIVSTQPIAVPAVIVPSWWAATADKQWVAPMNNAAAIAAGKSYLGDSAVEDPLAFTTNRGNGPSNKYDAYNGIAPDRQRCQGMSPAQGGHANYYGNEVSYFDLKQSTPMWTRLRTADTAENVGSSATFRTWVATGRPAPDHTYSNQMGIKGRWIKFGQGPLPYLGNSDDGSVFEFRTDTNDWVDHGHPLNSNQYGGNTIPLYDELRDRVVIVSGAGSNASGTGSQAIMLSNVKGSTLTKTNISSANFEDGGELVGSIDTIHDVILVRGNAGFWWSKLPNLMSWTAVTSSGISFLTKHGFDWHHASGAFLTYVFGTGLLKGVPTVDASGNYTGLNWSVVSGTTGLTPPDYNRISGAGLYNRLWIGKDMGDGRDVLVYIPTYSFPDVYVMPLPRGGV